MYFQVSFLTITDKRNGLRRAAGVTLLLDKTLAANKEKREQVRTDTLQAASINTKNGCFAKPKNEKILLKHYDQEFCLNLRNFVCIWFAVFLSFAMQS